MASVVRSRSSSLASIHKSKEGRSLTPMTRSTSVKLAVPEPAASKQEIKDIGHSGSQLPHYSNYPLSDSISGTHAETQIDLDSAHNPSQGPAEKAPEQAPKAGPPPPYTGQKKLYGIQLALTVFVLAFGLFLATLESTIVSTALVTIASELGDYQKASWVVVTYLLTYTSFLVVWTRLSDIFGRKLLLIGATLTFVASSVGCALSPNMNTLIGCRALQGIGGSGLYALSYSSVMDVVPFRLMAPVTGALSMATACSSVLGPVLGGLITTHTTWRWVFWINAPSGAFIIVFVFFIFPSTSGNFTMSNLRQIDILGVFLSLGAAITLIVPLEEGGSAYAWSSMVIIFLIVASGVFWTGFAVWETWLTKRGNKTRLLPIFPMRLLSGRVIASTFATGFLAGFPFMVVIVQMPQRFQVVNGFTPSTAGIHMLPLLSVVAVGAFTTGIITSKINISWYLLVGSSVLTTVGIGMLSTLPTTGTIPGITYFYEVILGFGFGMTLTSLMVVVRGEVQPQDNAVATGAITQIRTLGGVIGISVVQAVMTHHVRSSLITVLSAEQMALVLDSTSNIGLLEPALEAATRSVYGSAINMQFRIITGFSAAAFGAALFCFRRKPVDMKAMAAKRMAMENGLPPPSDSASGANKDASQPAGPQRCCSVDGQCQAQHGGWDAESQSYEGDDKHWEMEKQESAFYESKWDSDSQSEAWTLTNLPIPQGQLFRPAELTCPRCGYSMEEKES